MNREAIVEVLNSIKDGTSEILSEIKSIQMWGYTVNIPLSHMFISQVAHKAGLDNNQAPFTANCDEGANWFRAKKKYKMGWNYGGSYTPQAGDVVYFSSTHQQADATSAGYVVEWDGALLQVVYYYNGHIVTEMRYMSEDIIGFGIFDYYYYNEVQQKGLEVTPISTAIANDELQVYGVPNDMSIVMGKIKKGMSTEVIEVVDGGWLKVLWRISPKGYGFIKPNCQLIPHVDSYQEQRQVLFKVGERVQSKATRSFQYPTVAKGRPRVCKPCSVTIEEVDVQKKMYKVSGPACKGWIYQKDVDFIKQSEYNGVIGEVTKFVTELRVGPGTEFTKVQQWPQLVKGNRVDILSELDGWYQVVICGVKGYVNSEHIKLMEV